MKPFDSLQQQYGNCTKHQACETTWTQHTCMESPDSIMRYCHKKKLIDIKSKQEVKHYPFHIHLFSEDHRYAGVSVNVVTGRANSIGPHDVTFIMQGRIPSSLDCHSLQGQVTSIKTVNHTTRLD